MKEAVEWLAGLSPWPEDGFGLERMRELLRELGNPQLAYPAVHVVGTNGKSTATRTVEALLLAEGLAVGANVSPHVERWSERITVAGAEVEIDAAISRVRTAAEELAATQFETITAAALTEFAARGVDVAVVEAGLGGRLDATNVLRSRVVLLTNVAAEHTDVLGEAPEQIAREKLAVAHTDSVVVLPDNEFSALVPGRRAVIGGTREAAEAFLGRSTAAKVDVALPGRLERRRGEVRDGAHNPEAARWLAAQLSGADYTICASILRDKDTDTMLAALAEVGSRFVATASSNTRALPADALANKARRHFRQVEVVSDPALAVSRAHQLGEPVLITGSLYLLTDLAERESSADEEPKAAWRK